jgi:hypothetical protein
LSSPEKQKTGRGLADFLLLFGQIKYTTAGEFLSSPAKNFKNCARRKNKQN